MSEKSLEDAKQLLREIEANRDRERKVDNRQEVIDRLQSFKADLDKKKGD